jgi:pSer/pThr/pTyr-binding forkhead associated (FHA) protein
VPALVVVDGPLEGRRFELGAAETTLGRDGATIEIDDPELSRRHAAVRAAGEAIEIEDLQSLNGTFVNGERLTAARTLAGGDTVKIGKTTLRFEVPARSAATVVSPRPAAPQTRIAPARPLPPRPEPPTERQTPPAEPFGHYAGQAGGRARVASRLVTAELFTVACVIGTAVALVIYFAAR